MLKGVNKNVIEVKNSNSKYFDRAILFLKEVQLPEPVQLSHLADAYLREMDRSYHTRLVVRLVISGVRFVLAVSAGAVVALLAVQ